MAAFVVNEACAMSHRGRNTTRAVDVTLTSQHPLSQMKLYDELANSLAWSLTGQ